ncbi:hypothetical protein P692DRAFT_20834149 [Suillus brevipes Sb2]|nr:hypothetical protein P692DRAFT_20834149 [Suillus brevipes Sb2]
MLPASGQGGYVIPSRPTLFALALTCRAFSEQALDALWEFLIGFMRKRAARKRLPHHSNRSSAGHYRLLFKSRPMCYVSF